MRIISGEWRGRPLVAPDGQATRPTSDRAREGLFSMLASRLGSFDGLRVGDLFAGTGALGLEALSRGAAHCLFIEKDRTALAALEKNIVRLGAVDRSEVRAQPVEHAPMPRQPLDLILLDPPYRGGLAQAAIDRVADTGWLSGGGWISLELAAGESVAIPDRLLLDRERRSGKARILLLRVP